MNYGYRESEPAKRKVRSARSQIHSGSILLGLVGGAIIAVAIITATSQSRLSTRVTENLAPINKAEFSMPTQEQLLMI